MDAHDAIKQAVDGHYEEIAKAIGRSANLVHRWTLPVTDFSESGAYSDLDRLEALMEKSLALGTPVSKALAPIYRLSSRFGGHFIPPAPVVCESWDIARQLTLTMRKVGDLLASTAEALEDDKITPNERRDLLQKYHEGLHELSQLVSLVEAGREG